MMDNIDKALATRLEELKNVLQDYYDGGDKLFNYGLCFDYVPATNGTDGYFRWQLSWGGPGDEFRFYTDARLHLYKVEYAFFDWFKGDIKELKHEDYELLSELFDIFQDAGACEHALSEHDE